MRLIVNIAVLVLVLAPFPAMAQGSYVPVLPGSRIETKRLLSQWEVAAVVIATLRDFGIPTTNGGPGQFTYSGMNFTVDKWLKGKCPKSLVVKVKISYGYEEENPILGTKYVVFVFKAPGENFLRAVKMLPADSVTIREVRDAISSVRLATPPPKPAQGTLLPGIPGLIQ